MSSESILFNNNLLYKQQAPLSLVETRNRKKHYFDKRVYQEGETLKMFFDSREDFINWSNSSIVMTIQLKNTRSDDEFNFYNFGSASNAFKNIRIDHLCGENMVSINDLDYYNQVKDNLTYSPQWLRTTGALMGHDQTMKLEVSNQFKKQYSIPMDEICNFFKPQNCSLMPSQLAKFHLEIDLSDFYRVFQSLVNSTHFGVTYEISNIYIDCEHCTLNDATYTEMVKRASKNLMNYVFDDVHSQYSLIPAIESPSGIILESQLKMKNATMAIVCFNGYDVGQPVDVDRRQLLYMHGEYQFMVGSNHYPHDLSDNSNLSYQSALIAYDKHKHIDDVAVSYEEFINEFAPYIQTLERDRDLSFTGTSLDSSKVFRFILDNPVSFNYNVEVRLFIPHTVNVRVNNIEVNKSE